MLQVLQPSRTYAALVCCKCTWLSNRYQTCLLGLALMRVKKEVGRSQASSSTVKPAEQWHLEGHVQYLRSFIRDTGSQACHSQQHGIAQARHTPQDALDHTHSLAAYTSISMQREACRRCTGLSAALTSVACVCTLAQELHASKPDYVLTGRLSMLQPLPFVADCFLGTVQICNPDQKVLVRQL